MSVLGQSIAINFSDLINSILALITIIIKYVAVIMPSVCMTQAIGNAKAITQDLKLKAALEWYNIFQYYSNSTT